MRSSSLVVFLVALFVLGACSVPLKTQKPSSSVTAVASSVVVTSRSTVSITTPPPSSPTAVPSIACQQVDKELLTMMKSQFGRPTSTAIVEVGPGNDPKETWWVVVMISPPDDAYQWGERAFLTNAPNHRDPDAWTWIVLEGSDPWAAVNWDKSKLERGQVALAQAKACLKASSH